MKQRDDDGSAIQTTRGARFAVILAALGLITWLCLIVVLMPYEVESGSR